MKRQFALYLLVFFFSFACSNSSNNQESEDKDLAAEELVENTESLEVATQNQIPDTLFYCIADGDVGAGGFDLVNYHTQNAAVLGNKEISATHDAIVYLFISEENKSEFLSKPDYYLPAYGGWCAMTLAMGRATKPVYENFLIDDNGKLHLFERTVSVNGRTLWQMDPETNAEVAGNNYDDYREDGIIEAASE